MMKTIMQSEIILSFIVKKITNELTNTSNIKDTNL